MKLPPTWRLKRVREVGHVQAGRQRSPNFTKGTFRQYLRVANIYDGNIDTSDVLSMKFTDKEYEVYKLHQGDILLNEGQSRELVGRCAMYVGEPADCCFQNTLIRFQAGEDCLPEYAAHLFSYCYLSGVFSSISSQTTSIAHLGVSRFADLKLPFPPREEQKKIGTILACQNVELACVERVLAAKQRRRQALTQRLLTGKTRLPGFTQSWQPAELGALFKERRETGREDLPLLAITGDRGIVNREELAKRDTSCEDKRRYLRIAPGDIGYNTMRMWQGVCALSNLEGIVSPAYTICTPRRGVSAEFMAQLFQLPATVHLFHRHSQGLVDDTLNLKFKHFARIKLAVPTEVKEQQAIAAILNEADREITLHRAELDALKRQKRGLMQQLLTGKVRVP